MNSVFQLEELQNLLRDFYHITNIRITVFDAELNELVSYPDSCAPFCSLIRSTPEGRAACARCDRDACRIASRQNKTYIYRCHAGLTEAIMPLHIGNALVGYLLCGQVFAYDSFESGWEAISNCCAQYPIDPDSLKESCRSSPLIAKGYIDSAARILHATASYLILEQMATLQADSDAARLDAFLSAHFTENLSANTICEKLNLGRSKLYKLSAQLYGCGISRHIKMLRIDKAKQLLTDRPDLSITEIAMNCGFSDYNYFIAVFSQCVGISPNAFRKKRRIP